MSAGLTAGPLHTFNPNGAKLLGARDFNVAADVSTAAVSPVYAVLGSTLPLTPPIALSELYISFSVSWFHSGPTAGNIAASFRLLRNGVLIPPSRAAAGNELRSRISTEAYVHRLTGITNVPQIITVEWARFGGVLGDLLEIRAAALPDLFQASLVVQNWKPSP